MTSYTFILNLISTFLMYFLLFIYAYTYVYTYILYICENKITSLFETNFILIHNVVNCTHPLSICTCITHLGVNVHVN